MKQERDVATTLSDKPYSDHYAVCDIIATHNSDLNIEEVMKDRLIDPARRTCLTALLAAPIGGTLAGCSKANSSSAAPHSTLEESNSSATTTPTSTPETETTPASTPTPSPTADDSQLGNPIVPSDPQRNYVFGPVPMTAVTGSANVGVGEAVLRSMTTGFGNTAIGDQAMWQQQTGINCVAVGYLAMFEAISCIDCTVVGTGALQNAQDGVGATAVGRLSCNELTSANNNSGFGDSTLRRTTTGVGNTAVGYRAAEANVDGTGNVSAGAMAAVGIVGGDRNVAVGFHAMSQVESTTEENVAVGAHSLEQASGGWNVAVGTSAGWTLTSGRNNVFIGNGAGESQLQNPDVENSIAIGDHAFTTQDNQIVIGNDRTQTLVLGDITITREQLLNLLALVS